MVLRHYNGIDATDQMNVFHPTGSLDKFLAVFYVANLKTKEAVITCDKKGIIEYSSKKLVRK